MLTSSLNPSVYGQKVTWTATVTTSGLVAPTGRVNFTWDGYSIGTATLSFTALMTVFRVNAVVLPAAVVGVATGYPASQHRYQAAVRR